MSSLLIIDDSEAVLAKMKSALVAAGFNVVTTMQTVGAARYLRQSDLVLIEDWMNRWLAWPKMIVIARWSSRELHARDRSRSVSRASRAPASGRGKRRPTSRR
jgi:DNA-binding NtrC family response regulator